MPRWDHTLTFDTEGLTLIEWYIQELPKYIAKHKNEPEYNDQILTAQSKLNLLSELGLMVDKKAAISRP